jgi:hypothetical protein
MQHFSNNATTSLAADLTDSATTLTVASSSAFATLSAGDWEMVTLAAGDALEIVKVTARDGDEWTVERAQEGTTAQAWDTGDTVQARLTAGSAAGFVQTAGISKAIGTGATANATDGVAIGASANAGAYSAALGSNANASGQGGVAMGYAATASGTDSLSLGANTDATQAEAIAAGSLAQATGGQGIAVGKAATASASQSIAHGVFANSAGLGSVSIGWESDALADYGAAVGPYAQSTASYTVAMGYAASASAESAIAIGKSSAASEVLGVALGHQSSAAQSAVAVGPNAKATATAATALGSSSNAHGARSCAINGHDAFSPRSVVARGFWSVPEDDWNDQFENYSAGAESTFAMPYVDLAAPPAWAASTQYSHGDVVVPTTGGTVQYRAWCSYADETLLHLTPTSGETEPTWPGAGGSVAINGTDNAEWIGIDLDAGYETESVPEWLDFYPTEIAFICQHYAATTGTPTISVGTASAPTLILNAAQVGITGAGQIYRFTLPNPCPRISSGEAILVTLDAAASAGRMVGRFLLTGAFVATKGRSAGA